WNIYGADGVTALLILHSYPMVYIIVSNALRSLPGDLEQAARISGASSFTTIRTITLPLLRPALLSAFTLTAVANLSDFGIPALLGSPARFETRSEERRVGKGCRSRGTKYQERTRYKDDPRGAHMSSDT